MGGSIQRLSLVAVSAVALGALGGCGSPGRQQLQTLIQRGVAHPVQLGPLQKLSPQGLVFGPSQVKVGMADGSSLRVRQLLLKLDLGASIWQRRPVLVIGLRGLDLELCRNRQGQYWVFPKGKGKAPNLQLKLRLLEPGLLRIRPGGSWRWRQGELDLDLGHRQLQLSSLLQPQGQGGGQGKPPGELRLQLRHRWGPRGQHQLQLGLRRLPLEVLAPLWPGLPLDSLGGVVSGSLRLDRHQGRWHCLGPLRLEQLSLARRGWGAPLLSPLVPLVCRGEHLDLAWAPWQWRQWRGQLSGRLSFLPLRPLALQLRGQLQARAPWPAVQARALLHRNRQGWQLRQLELRSGRSRLRASGQLRPQLRLRSQELTLDPSPWLPQRQGMPLLQAQLQLDNHHWQLLLPRLVQPTPGGELRLAAWAQGRWRGGIALESLRGDYQLPQGWSRQGQRLLGPLAGDFHWSGGRLLATGETSPQASYPLSFQGWWQPLPGKPWRTAPLQLQAQWQRLPLALLNPRAQLHGWLSGSARLSGPLAKPLLLADLDLDQPGIGPLQWRERWSGSWQPGLLTLQAPGARLRAQLKGQRLMALDLERGLGSLQLRPQGAGYRWQGRQLPLNPLHLQLPGRPPLPLDGELDGQGQLTLAPFGLKGALVLNQPALAWIRGRRLELRGQLRPPGFDLAGRLQPLARGQFNFSGRGAWGGQLDLQAKGRGLEPAPLFRLLQALRQPPGPGSSGKAQDLADLVVDTFGGSLDGQLQALQEADQRLALRRANVEQRRLPLGQLQGRLDADLELRGANPRSLQLNGATRGHLWFEGQDRDQVLQLAPFTAQIQGPLGQGEGSFSFAGLPLGLIALLTPVPASLRGSLGATGRWQLGQGSPQLSLQLALTGGELRDKALSLEKGALALEGGKLRLDLALRGGQSSSSIDLAGSLPLNPLAPGLELRLSSRNDGLIFLSALAGGELEWQQGSADLQLLVRGSLRQPIANGFLRVRDGQLKLAGQAVRDLQAAAFFDFRRLQLEQFSASVGAAGLLEGKGSLPLQNSTETDSLKFLLKAVPFQRANLRLQADGELLVSGSLDRPLLGGELSLSRGRVLLGASQLVGGAGKPIPLAVRLPESRWGFNQPLVLLGPSVESSSGAALRQAIPNLAFLQFRDLRLSLGPDLRLGAPPVADFSTGGLLTLNGPMGPDISLSGVVRLLQGRVNIFTSSLRLDTDSPNVAVFTPSLGLIPYLDLALTTRVSSQVRPIDSGGVLSADQLQGSFSNLDRLNLVKVVVRVAGPADRIGDNLEIRSTPPLPRERLVALLGGNTLSGLSGGDAGTALVTVLGQSLLTPVVGGLSELLGQQLNVALYPTYLDPYVLSGSKGNSSNQRVPSQLVLGSEVGLDLTDRLNFSVLAAPNRSDIPPEATLRYQANDLLGLQGSLDQEGRWQGQVQLFFRF